MKIIYLHQYFRTPKEAGGTRSYWISKKLIDRGHQVVMVSGSSILNRHSSCVRTIVDGIEVIYVRNRYENKMKKWRRIISFIGFMCRSISVVMREKKVDLVFATSTPLTVGISALIVKKLRRIPFLFEVRDLWPDFPVQMGVVRWGIMRKFLYFAERKIYENAVQIIALSPGMREGILRSGDFRDKVSVIPNMSKPEIFYPREKNIREACRFGIDLRKFHVITFGAMGTANGLDYIIRSAEILAGRCDPDIRFIFLGDGMVRDRLIKYCRKNSIHNVLFIDPQPMNLTSELVNLADVSLVTFLNLPVLATNSPNKFFDSLAAGKPVIVNSNGWTRTLIEENRCGFFSDPENPNDLANLLLRLKKNPELVAGLGRNARSLSFRFDKDDLTSYIADLAANV